MHRLFIKTICLTAILVFCFTNSAEAQKKRRPTTVNRTTTVEEEEDDKFIDKLNFEIKAGNVNFWNNIFQLSAKPDVGYKFNKTFTGGLGGKFFYSYIGGQWANSGSNLDYGGFAFARGKITDALYLQAEYNILNLDYSNFGHQAIEYFSAGGGYMQRGDKWSYGAELIINFNSVIQNNIGILEYWINFSYNF